MATSRSSARRRDDIKGLGLTEIVDHYEEQIDALDEPPVLIGHSFGGLIVELLLDRGLGRAGVAMSPAPPKGILVLPFSSLKAAAPALAHPSKWHGVVPLTLEEFTYGFVNTFSPEDAKAAYDSYAVPETGQIFFEAGFANFHLHPPTEVHFKSDDRAPLLIVGAEKDNTVPASLAKKQYEKYEKSSAQTDYVEFPGRPHLMMVGEGWEEIAGHRDWLGVLAGDGVRCTRGSGRLASTHDTPARPSGPTSAADRKGDDVRTATVARSSRRSRASDALRGTGGARGRLREASPRRGSRGAHRECPRAERRRVRHRAP